MAGILHSQRKHYWIIGHLDACLMNSFRRTVSFNSRFALVPQPTSRVLILPRFFHPSRPYTVPRYEMQNSFCTPPSDGGGRTSWPRLLSCALQQLRLQNPLRMNQTHALLVPIRLNLSGGRANPNIATLRASSPARDGCGARKKSKRWIDPSL